MRVVPSGSPRVSLISKHRDQGRAAGFRSSSVVHLNVSRSNTRCATLLQPVKSTDERVHRLKIRAQMKGTSVTVVLIGKDTA